MAGALLLKEIAAYTLSTSNCASISASTVTTAIGNNFDCRSTGTSAAAAIFELICSFNVTTGIVFNSNVADLYLIPAPDGTNFPDIDTSHVSPNHYVGSFLAAKTPVVSTNVRFATGPIDVFPALYQAAIFAVPGPINSSWTLKVTPAQGSYT